MRTQLTIIFILLHTSIFSQHGWSYDTITEKKIIQTSIYRTEYKNGLASKDSVLIAMRHYHNGLKINEVYFDRCKDVKCNDAIIYYYNAPKLLTKIIEPDYYHKSIKVSNPNWFKNQQKTKSVFSSHHLHVN